MKEENSSIDVLIVKAREHKTVYTENIEDIRIGYLCSVFHKNNISTKILDFAFSKHSPSQDSSDLSSEIRSYKPLIVIFIIDKSPTNSPQYTLDLLDDMKSADLLKNSHITLYGNTQVGCFTFFKHQIDSVILGEEDSALSLVLSVKNKTFPSCAQGIAYKTNGDIINIISAERNLDIDSLPYPYRYAKDMVEKSQYSASILSSRGCFGQCNYCYMRSKEKYFRHYGWIGRSIKNVVDEIELLYSQGVTEFSFVDDEFLPFGEKGEKRATQFAEEIIHRGLHISYSIYSRSDCISEKVIKALKSSGLYCVFLGVESFSQSALNRYKKSLTVSDNINAIEILKKYKIHIRLGMILFDKDTTIQEIGESINILKQISSSDYELLFQSMYFSNALIPLMDTPSEKEYKNMQQEIINDDLKTICSRRSRDTIQAYPFIDQKVSDVFSCVQSMSTEMLELSMEKENLFFKRGYDDYQYTWFKGATRFAITQLEKIYELIIKGSTVQACKSIIQNNIMRYNLEAK